MFKFTIELDKQFLQVSCETHSNTTCPEDFLNEQSNLWASYWCPKEHSDLDNTLPTEYCAFRDNALFDNIPVSFTADTLDFALKGYKKKNGS